MGLRWWAHVGPNETPAMRYDRRLGRLRVMLHAAVDEFLGRAAGR